MKYGSISRNNVQCKGETVAWAGDCRYGSPGISGGAPSGRAGLERGAGTDLYGFQRTD